MNLAHAYKFRNLTLNNKLEMSSIFLLMTRRGIRLWSSLSKTFALTLFCFVPFPVSQVIIALSLETHDRLIESPYHLLEIIIGCAL